MDGVLRIINREAVRRLLTYDACIPLMGKAMVALSTGRTKQLLRQIIDLDGGKAFGVMPGAMEQTFGAKILSVYPDQPGVQSHQGMVILFDPKSGAPIAVIHAGEVTAIRTAAASAAATLALARPGSGRLAVLGAGEQAQTHLAALGQALPLTEIRIWARSPDKAQALAQKTLQAGGPKIVVCDTVRSAVADADVICTTTASNEPILLGEWVKAGAHINLVGSSRAGPREVDDQLVIRSRFFADHREGVLRQGAEFLHAKAAGGIGDDHILGEIGEVMAGVVPGRLSEEDVTVYKSLGSVVQDLVSGWLIYERALAAGEGVGAPF